MSTILIHLSDFHNKNGIYENHPVVVDSFFEDLKKQLELLSIKQIFLVFSGDIANSADNDEQYEGFFKLFNEKLTELGIPVENRICVPGNHDLSRQYVQANQVMHEAVVSQKLNETQFNDFILAPNILINKFSNYLKFQNRFAKYGLTDQQITGVGWSLTDNIGIYCLNSALCSSGGLELDGKVLKDERRLRVDTRSLYKWIQETKASCKILVMHHPLYWLDEANEKELKTILNKHFKLRLFGHVHEQDSLHSMNAEKSLIECCAPALFSKKQDQLGYSLFVIDETFGVREIIYRQWTKFQSFVTGANFSNTENGKLSYHENLFNRIQPVVQNGQDLVHKYYYNKLNKALISFSGQPKIWVEPIIKTKPELEKDEASIQPIDINKLILNPVSTIINADPQFGLTCLAHHIVLKAWEKNSLWLYLDVSEMKAGTVKEYVASELGEIGLSMSEVKCVVVDSVGSLVKDSWKIVTKIINHFPALPIICMRTLDSNIFSKEVTLTPDLSINFEHCYLWTLSRNLIRSIVTDYNNQIHVADEDVVITKIVADLEMLNLHRTPLNCLTLLKVSEVDFDESPVNRSEMIKRVLFLLFNTDDLPGYKIRPDLKDCEFVLGYFCEKLLKSNNNIFTKNDFLSSLNTCCKEAFIELETNNVFDILNENNIIVSRDGQFAFKFSFWIYYFAAVRMHHDDAFAKYMLSDQRYSSLPELIEFYTGIDRRRDDAIAVLTQDLIKNRLIVEAKCGFPKNMDPYQFAQWAPSELTLAKMKSEIGEGIKGSNLPSEIKDKFADQNYDSSRPYDQSVAILTHQSLTSLMQTIRSSAKALRNSDYVKPIIKRALLEEILKAWEQLTMVLLVVAPILADKGEAVFEGASFVLDGNFGETVQQRAMSILLEIPGNVVKWSKDDLNSQKMGPLFLDVFANESVQIRRHELSLLLISQKPNGWRDSIQNYIADIPKNSFYLLDVYRALRTQYRYSFVSNKTLKDIEYLIKMSITKHVTGDKNPGVKLVEKTIPRLTGEPIIPVREV